MSLFILSKTTQPWRTFGEIRRTFSILPNDMPVQWQVEGAVLVTTVAGILETWANVPDDTPFTDSIEYSGSGWGFDIYGHVSKLDNDE